MRAKKTTRDNYLRRKFGVTESAYNHQLKEQGGGCRFCGRVATNVSLHVDHDHKVEAMKIVSQKREDGWLAWPKETSGVFGFSCEGKTKAEARLKVKQHLKRLSVRFILCWACNAGIRKFLDNPKALQNAGFYLNQYYNHLELDGPLSPMWETE